MTLAYAIAHSPALRPSGHGLVACVVALRGKRREDGIQYD